jgi:hypothetical protein
MLVIDERVVRQPRRGDIRLALWRALNVADQGSGEDEDPRATPDPVSRERLQLANAGILHLSPIMRQLVDLWNGPENDDLGRLRPTQYAFDRVIQLLLDVAITAHSDRRKVPFGCVSTDSAGGVRIEWVCKSVSVHWIVPAAEEGAEYIYHEVGDEYATEDEVTPARLWHWLRLIA